MAECRKLGLADASEEIGRRAEGFDDLGDELRRIVMDEMAELRTEGAARDEFLDDQDEG